MDPDFEEKAQPPQELVEALNFIAVTPFYEVLVLFADQLAKKFPSKNLRARRDFKKLLYIVGAVAFLHQLQRPIVYKAKTRQYIVALPVDFLIAWEVAEEGMKETLLNIQKRSLEVLELFKDSYVEGFTSRQVATQTRLSQNRAREILNGLVNFGYLVRDRSQKEHLFLLKGNIDVDNTISDFESSILSFDEKKLEEWLTQQKLITRYRVRYPTEYVNPINGEELPVFYITPSRVMTKSETEQESTVKQQKSLKETSVSSIVPSLKQIDIQTVLKVVALDPIAHGNCSICKKRGVILVWQVQFMDGTRYHAVCMDCGGYLQEELRKRDKA